jgi:HTH-type transcriptional regulator/antitoxin HigA
MILTFDINVYGNLLAEVQPKVITSEEENERYLAIVERFMAGKNRTPEQNALLQLLVTLIEDFEDKHYSTSWIDEVFI